MVPDIVYEYARERFRQMMLNGSDYSRAQEWRQLFLRRYEASPEQAHSTGGRSNTALREFAETLSPLAR